MDGYIGEIRMFGGNFAPRNWFLCQGQLLSVAKYPTLFSIIGTIYGGDGRTTMGLPDLRGRMPMGTGNGPGLQPATEGQRPGNEITYLNTQNLPPHLHTAQTAFTGTPTLNAYNTGLGTGANSQDPTGRVLADPTSNLYTDQAPNVKMSPDSLSMDGISATTTVGLTGNGTGFSNIPPAQVVNFIICYEGIFPSRT